MTDFDVIVIGAGGAGMMCAIEAGRRGRRVALLDHATRLGRKILISGGGRCNFTNIYASPANYVSNNPHFCKSALSRYTPDDFIALVKRHRIAFHEKKLGQLFCDGSAQQIVDMLVDECRSAGAVFRLECQVRDVRKDGRFSIQTNHGRYTCDSLVIATGGLSVPQTGATGFGYDMARRFALKIVDPQPALDGFVFTQRQLKELAELAGVSIDTIVSCNSASFRENILFTHCGLSGPASLQASLYWNKGDTVTIDLLPEFDLYRWLLERRKEGTRTQLKNLLAELLPKRFAEKFCELFVPSHPLVKYSDRQIESICRQIHEWQIVPGGTVGFRKAEVTRGGVDTDELSSKTMESKKVSGLYFIGEVVDVTGWLGGYNFQWAWASGFAAGQYV
ncbi:MAG TPA: NAD(P)/FAD-dependent oxidoreductase [Candidatus Obscuribacterales bacterium]